jgi:hypothetical protein
VPDISGSEAIFFSMAAFTSASFGLQLVNAAVATMAVAINTFASFIFELV